jgi:hypothetical protein
LLTISVEANASHADVEAQPPTLVVRQSLATMWCGKAAGHLRDKSRLTRVAGDDSIAA